MSKNNIKQTFELDNSILTFDVEKSILLCSLKTEDRKNAWIKKLIDVTCISNVIEDISKYYIACESGDINGQFLAVLKESGETKWFIPGMSFLQVNFNGYLYLIFIDEEDNYYLVKIHRSNGSLRWHHKVEKDLKEYVFSEDKIKLSYSSGKKETLSVLTGRIIH